MCINWSLHIWHCICNLLATSTLWLGFEPFVTEKNVLKLYFLQWDPWDRMMYSVIFLKLVVCVKSGVLSPLLFNVYFDNLACQLEASNLGCCINGMHLFRLSHVCRWSLTNIHIFLTVPSVLDLCRDCGAIDIILNLIVRSYVAWKLFMTIWIKLVTCYWLGWQARIFRYCFYCREQFTRWLQIYYKNVLCCL